MGNELERKRGAWDYRVSENWSVQLFASVRKPDPAGPSGRPGRPAIARIPHRRTTAPQRNLPTMIRTLPVTTWIVLLALTQASVGVAVAAPVPDATASGSLADTIDETTDLDAHLDVSIALMESTRGVTAGTSNAAGSDAIELPALSTRQPAAVEFVSRPVPLLLVGYSRYDGSDPLELGNRQLLFETVTAEPGLSLAQLAARTEVPVSTVRYHTRILAEEGLLRTEQLHGRHRVFPAGTDNLELATALADGPTRAVLDAVSAHEPVSVTSLADLVDRSPSTVSYHLDRLEGSGLVVRERAGPTVHISVTPAVALPDGPG